MTGVSTGMAPDHRIIDIIDLHTHSTASDGQYPPSEVAVRAARAGTVAWALTDHDTVAGLGVAAEAARRLGIRFVPGIELSVFPDENTSRAREIHVLGHFIDPARRELRAFEDELADQRRGRVREIVKLLAKNGVQVTEEAIVACSGGKTIGRPHVARAMVQGALTRSKAQVAVAVTGVAGPTGGSPAKPVGTVWFGFAVPGQVITEKCHFDGDRAAVRAATVQHAFTRLLQLLS